MLPSSNEDTNAQWYNGWKSKMDSGKSSPYPWLSFSVFRDGTYSVKPNSVSQRPTTSGTYKTQRLLGTNRSNSAAGHRRKGTNSRQQTSPTPDQSQPQAPQFGHLTAALHSRTVGRATPISNVQVSVSGGVGNTPTHTVIKTKYGRKIRVPASRSSQIEQSVLPPETESTKPEPKTEPTKDTSGFHLSTEKGKPKKPPTPTNAGDIKDVENLEEIEKTVQSSQLKRHEQKPELSKPVAETIAPTQTRITLPQNPSASKDRVPSYGLPNSVAKSQQQQQAKPPTPATNGLSEPVTLLPAHTSAPAPMPTVITPVDIVPKTVTHVIPVGANQPKTLEQQVPPNSQKPVFSFAHSTTSGNVTSLSYMSFLNKLQEKHNLTQINTEPAAMGNHVGASTTLHQRATTVNKTPVSKTPESKTQPTNTSSTTVTIASSPAVSTATTTSNSLPTFSVHSLNKNNHTLVTQTHNEVHRNNKEETNNNHDSQSSKPLYSVTDGDSTTEIYPIKSILKKGAINAFKSHGEKLSPASRPHTAGGSQRIAILKTPEAPIAVPPSDHGQIRTSVRRTPSLMNGEISLRTRSYSAGPKRGVRFDMTSNSVHEYEPTPSALNQPPAYINDNEHWYKLMWRKLAEDQ